MISSSCIPLRLISNPIFRIWKVFVQDNHEAASSPVYSPACSKKAWLARRTASAIASLVTLPHYSSTMVSQASGDLFQHL